MAHRRCGKEEDRWCTDRRVDGGSGKHTTIYATILRCVLWIRHYIAIYSSCNLQLCRLGPLHCAYPYENAPLHCTHTM